MSLMAFLMIVGSTPATAQKAATTPPEVLGFTMKDIDGKDVALSRYKGDVVLIVNVASRCGKTPQYEGLEHLYRTYRDKGFMILGFPANNFLGQEPGTDAQIKEFCTTKYGVTFDMFSKISVKGKDKHPLYRLLTSDAENPGFGGEVTWNFTKYLINREGRVVAKFAPGVKPMSDEIVQAVEAALQ